MIVEIDGFGVVCVFAPREVRLGPDGAAEEPSWPPALCAQGSGAFPTARCSVLFCHTQHPAPLPQK